MGEKPCHTHTLRPWTSGKSARATALTRSCAGSTCASNPGRSSACSDETGRASPRSSRSCAACAAPTREPHPSAATGPASAEAARSIGYAPQELGIYPDLSVAQNLAAFGELHGLGRREAASRAGEVMDLLGLSREARAARLTPVGRTATQAPRGHGDHAPPAPGVHGRADRRRGRGGAQPDPARGPPARRRRSGRRLHLALPRRVRGAWLRHRDPERGAHRRERHARGDRRCTTGAPRSRSSSTAPFPRSTGGAPTTGVSDTSGTRPTRVRGSAKPWPRPPSKARA